MKKDITNKVDSYESACEVLGEKPVTDFGEATPDEIAYKKLKTVVKALNGDWKADYTNGDQRKWFPWFRAGSSGFSFLATCYESSTPYAGDAARLCLKSEELATYAGEQFLNLWKDFII
jgi:hypothetical protein